VDPTQFFLKRVPRPGFLARFTAPGERVLLVVIVLVFFLGFPGCVSVLHLRFFSIADLVVPFSFGASSLDGPR